MFHESIELARAPDATPVAELKARASRRAAEEVELVVDPLLFDALALRLPDLAGMRVELRGGRACNEMTQFRYDVILRKRGPSSCSALEAPIGTVPAPRPCSLEALRELLRDAPPCLRVADVPNARLARAATTISGQTPATVGDLRAALRANVEEGLDPEDVRAIDPAYDVQVSFARERADCMDVLFRRRSEQSALEAPATHVASQALASYANRPIRRSSSGGGLIHLLRAHAKERLPEYMVPGTIVLLEALPLTANGKIDRAKLPAPGDLGRATAARFVAPKADLERLIAGVFAELLAASEIGMDDNFFDLGANSLIMVKASVRLREAIGRSVSIVRLFQFPSVRALSTALGADESKTVTTDSGGQERAQARNDAIQRRQAVRRITRPQTS